MIGRRHRLKVVRGAPYGRDLWPLLEEAVTEVRACREAIDGTAPEARGLEAIADRLDGLRGAIGAAAAALLIADTVFGPVRSRACRGHLQLVEGDQQGADSRDGGAR
jgi:hypothetical protein